MGNNAVMELLFVFGAKEFVDTAARRRVLSAAITQRSELTYHRDWR